MRRGYPTLGTALQERGLRRSQAQQPLRTAYLQLIEAKVATRRAEALTGVSRSTMHRAAQAEATGGTGEKHPVPRPEPANKLSASERDQVLAVLHSDRFVDQAPQQIYATLLSEGQYLCSVSTMYRILHDHQQVADRRRQARHPARKIPELVAYKPGDVFSCYAEVWVMPITVTDRRIHAGVGQKLSA